MHGINNKPFIDCREFVDINELKLFEKEICIGLSKSVWQAGIYGPGILNESTRKSYMSLDAKYRMPENNFPEFNSLSRNQKSKFFKLYEKMYSASSVVYLRDFKEKTIKAYENKCKEEFTYLTDDAKNFPNLIKWIYKLPFDEIGRIIFFIHEHDCELLIHRDGVCYKPHNNEFLWINPNVDKDFFIYDENNDIKHYINTPIAFFNDLDMHGGGRPTHLSWSIRIDGKFSSYFRKQLNIDHLKNY